MEELRAPVAVAQRFLAENQDLNHKEVFQAVARHFDGQFSTAAAAQQVSSRQRMQLLQLECAALCTPFFSSFYSFFCCCAGAGAHT